MGSEIVGTKNNHKYFPEFMARSFYGKKPIKYLNASTGEIITVQNSNDFNTDFGYYTDENENLLNKEAEQKFQQLSRQVAKIAKSGKRDVSRLKVDPDIVYKFFAYQLWRDPTNSNAILNIFHNENILDKKDVSLQRFQNEAFKAEKEFCIATSELKSYFPLVIVEPNFTEEKFIAVNTPVRKEFTEGEIYILVTAPNVAFCLVSKGITTNLKINELEYTVRDEGLSFVRETNKCIMAHAIAHQPHIILGTNPEELRNLRIEVRQMIELYNQSVTFK